MTQTPRTDQQSILDDHAGGAQDRATGHGAGDCLAETTTERVAARLRQDILHAVFVPGGRIKLADIANRYAISLMPVREALRQLASEGLVDLLPNRGARVRSVDARFVANMYDLRGALEGMLAERAAPRLTAAGMQEMWRLLDTHAAAVQRGDIAEMMRANRAFHRHLNRAADNPEALRLIEHGWELIHALRLQFGFGAPRRMAIVRQHREIARAIEAQTAEVAGALTRDHCRDAREDLLHQFAATAA